MEHRKALALLDVAVDGLVTPAERMALEQHLAQCPECSARAKSMELLEANLRRVLQHGYPELPSDTRESTAILANIHQHHRREQMARNLFRNAAWGVLAIAATFALAWIFRNLTPRPNISANPTETNPPSASSPSIPTLTPVLPTVELNREETNLQHQRSVLFPEAHFILPAELPQAPESAMVYLQQAPEPATIDSVRQMAQKLEIQGEIYRQAGEGSFPVYSVSDGYSLLVFAYSTAEIFNYWSDSTQALARHGEPPSYQDALEVATAYLQERSLLDIPYRTEPIPAEPGGVRFVRLLDDRPVVYGIGYTPSLVDLDVIVDSKRQVKEVRYASRHFFSTQEYPIINPEQAWGRFLSSTSGDYLRYAFMDASDSPAQETWLRPYPLNQTLELYGYATVLQPAEMGKEAWVQFGNYPVRGANALAFANGVSPGDFLHVRGQLFEDSQGRVSLQLDSWEASSLEDLIVEGRLERDGGQAWISSEQGRYALPDLPGEIDAGGFASVRGVETRPGEMDWSIIQVGQPYSGGYGVYESCGGGGGGGGSNDIGGGRFLSLNLEGGLPAPTPTLTVYPAPYRPGDIVDGASGVISALRHRYADGREVLEISLVGDATEQFPGFWIARLNGTGIEDLVNSVNLPVRVWGQVDRIGEDGWPVIEVERFELVYPGLQIQAWMGTWQPINLEGQQVLLFTTQDGEAFVLGASIQYGADASAIGREGDMVIIEGFARPDRTFGGYPVIDESGGGIVPEGTTLEDYEITANRESVWDESLGLEGMAALPTGVGTVESVDLVYATASLQRCGEFPSNDPKEAPWLYVQPVWRFRGSLDDGRTFEIQVQALAEEYLK